MNADHRLPLKLRVEVLQARNLLPADPNGKSDPYCSISVGGSTAHKTDVQSATLDPVWKQSVVFLSEDLEPYATFRESGEVILLGHVTVTVWDYDVASADDLLGRVMIPFRCIPFTAIKESNSQWYALHRQNKDPSVGEIELNLHLEPLEGGLDHDRKSIVFDHTGLDRDVCTILSAHNFHLPVVWNGTAMDFPGRTEWVDMAFARVHVEMNSYRSEAMVLLTNYRLIILSMGDLQTKRGHSSEANTDLSMWIALSNISSTEHGSGSIVVRRHGVADNVDNYTLTINCYDCRSVRLIFVVHTAPENKTRASSIAQGQMLPGKFLKMVSEQTPIFRDLKDFTKKAIQFNSFSSKDENKRGEFIRKIMLESRRRSYAFSISTDEPKAESPVPEEGEIDEGEDSSQPEFSRRIAELKNSQKRTASIDVVASVNRQHSRSGLSLGQRSVSDSDLVGLESAAALLEDQLLDQASSLGTFSLSADTISRAGTGLTDVDTEEVLGSFARRKSIQELQEAYGRLVLPSTTKQLTKAFFLRLENMMATVVDEPPAYNFLRMLDSEVKKKVSPVSWGVQGAVHADMKRMMNSNWRVCGINSQDHCISPTYPPFIFVPAKASDALVEDCARFRSKQRIPTLVWRSKRHGNFMMRSAQPLPGLGKHSKGDEDYIKLAIAAGAKGRGLTIFDARSFTAATGNKIMGKGTEDISRYSDCKLQHLDIPNIHHVRDSYDALLQLALSSNNSKWLSALESTGWLNFISLILKGATMIARHLVLRRGNVLVHCSDGWDRTAQLTSLAQLMVDSTYRTIKGFMLLVDKEWLCYGHKFNHRLNNPVFPRERSPVFLQFLDCVQQMVKQYPTAFEFTKSLLTTIAQQLNTGWFGTFLFNCDRERVEHGVFSQTLPLWAHIEAIRDQLQNPLYYRTSELLTPSWNIRRLSLWEEYFLQWDDTSIDQSSSSPANESDKDAGEASKPSSVRMSKGDRHKTVVWMTNEQATLCLICHHKFTVVKRKHHCRACGGIFCNECSKNKAVMPNLGYVTPVRVCDACYRKSCSGSQSSADMNHFSEDGFEVVRMKVDPSQI